MRFQAPQPTWASSASSPTTRGSNRDVIAEGTQVLSVLRHPGSLMMRVAQRLSSSEVLLQRCREPLGPVTCVLANPLMTYITSELSAQTSIRPSCPESEEKHVSLQGT